VSNNLNATAPNSGSGVFQSLDYVSQLGQRALEGFYNFKLLNSELKTRQADLQWRMANDAALYGQSTGNGASPYGVGGVNSISSARPGYTSASMGFGGLPISNVGIAAAIGLALALAFFRK
jgi:hypothetical protein